MRLSAEALGAMGPFDDDKQPPLVCECLETSWATSWGAWYGMVWVWMEPLYRVPGQPITYRTVLRLPHQTCEASGQGPSLHSR